MSELNDDASIPTAVKAAVKAAIAAPATVVAPSTIIVTPPIHHRADHHPTNQAAQHRIRAAIPVAVAISFSSSHLDLK